jgi:membrane-associated phospholipid phosphatase
MPIAGCLFYFFAIPNYLDGQIIKAKLVAVAILTIFLPIVFLFIAKNLKLIQDYDLPHVKERRFFLMFFILLVLVLLNNVLDVYNYRTLFYFFSGILFSGIISLLFSMFRVKISLHTLGVSGLACFVTGLSLSFQEPMILFISLLILLLGLVGASRLYEKAHNLKEISIGVVAGILPQLYFFSYWM